jgi:hypothetical protein
MATSCCLLPTPIGSGPFELQKSGRDNRLLNQGPVETQKRYCFSTDSPRKAYGRRYGTGRCLGGGTYLSSNHVCLDKSRVRQVGAIYPGALSKMCNMIRRHQENECGFEQGPVSSFRRSTHQAFWKKMAPVQCRGLPVEKSASPSEDDESSRTTEKGELGPDGQPKRKYQDSPFDLAFIQVCRQAYGKLAQWQVSLSIGESAVCFSIDGQSQHC